MVGHLGSYPEFMADLKKSFCTDEFVKKHFSDPDAAWDDAATINKDGTLRIIESLNLIAPNLNDAREAKFSSDVSALVSKLLALLTNYYHTNDIMEEVRKAKKLARRANLQIDAQLGQDPYFFA